MDYAIDKRSVLRIIRNSPVFEKKFPAVIRTDDKPDLKRIFSLDSNLRYVVRLGLKQGIFGI